MVYRYAKVSNPVRKKDGYLRKSEVLLLHALYQGREARAAPHWLQQESLVIGSIGLLSSTEAGTAIGGAGELNEMKLLDVGLSLLLPIIVLVHLLVAPYTKVEESFNIQAIHDVLVYGTPTTRIQQRLTSNYDHFTFPGAVPRTFVGAVILAGIGQPIISSVGFQHGQIIVRALLGLWNTFALLVFAHNVRLSLGQQTARWYLLLQATQFHVMFYASRPLPNMFAFGLSEFPASPCLSWHMDLLTVSLPATLSSAFLLPHPDSQATVTRQRLAIAMFVFAAVIFRCEIALLLATNILYLLLVREVSPQQVMLPFIVSFPVALLVTVIIDSYFWQKPLWPELWGFYFNAVLGSSSNWGTSPVYWYFASALPRLLLNPISLVLLIPLSLRHAALASSAKRLVIPPLLFVITYSLQPHKEARFIIYAVPPLTAAASQGAMLVFNRRSKSALSAAVAIALLVSIIVSAAVSTAMLALSSLNYPGGDALAYLRVMATRGGGGGGESANTVYVHADVLSCMTGVTLFGSTTSSATPNLRGSALADGHEPGKLNGALVVDKNEDEKVLARPTFWTQFDYVLAEDPAKVMGGEWEDLGVVKGYGGVEILKPGATGEHVGGETALPVIGRGAAVDTIRERVRALTGGWWVGPKMIPRIHILKRLRDSERSREAVDT